MKRALICLSIIVILISCVLNVAVASASNYSISFHNNARHIGDNIPVARGSTSNGISNWKYATKGIAPPSAAPNDVVYVGSDDNNVYALDAATGMKVWNYTTGDIVRSSPTVVNGIVYIGGWDHNVYALDARTGGVVWSFMTGDSVQSCLLSPMESDRVRKGMGRT